MVPMFIALYVLSAAVAGMADPMLLLLAIPLIWLSVTDLNRQIIPDYANVAVLIWGVARNGYWGFPAVLNATVAAAILAVLWLSSEIYWRARGEEALGLGDVKLLAAAVFCVGAEKIWLTVLIASLGGIAAVAVTRFSSPTSGVPFGPFIAYGLFLTLIVSGA